MTRAEFDQDAFEADFIFGPRRRERFAYFVAAAGVIVGVVGFVGAVSLFPLKTVETFVVVVDKETGEILWKTKLPFGGNATPSTYTVSGRQYVVISAGGGKSGRPRGGVLVAFALPN